MIGDGEAIASAARPTEPKPQDLRAGQLWAARGADPDWRYIVVVLGKPESEQDLAMVVPIAEEVEQASDLDLIVPDSPLGYSHLILAWQHGPIFAGQLERFLGDLPTESTEALKRVYTTIVTGEANEVNEANEGVGPPLAGPDDPRRRFRSEKLEWLRPLWQPLREAVVSDEDEDEDEDSVDPKPALVGLFEKVFAEDEWDVVSLCEAAALDGQQWRRFSAGQLDLTGQLDLPQLARVFSELGRDFDEVAPAVEQTLWLNPGGQLRASPHEQRLAARSFSDVSEAQRQRDIQRGRRKVDESEAGRRAAVASYLNALAKAMDELS